MKKLKLESKSMKIGNLLPALSSLVWEGSGWEARERERTARSSPRTCVEVLILTRRIEQARLAVTRTIQGFYLW